MSYQLVDPSDVLTFSHEWTDCNLFLWLPDDDPPAFSTFPPFPSGFELVTGQEAQDIWEAAKQNWIDCHPNVKHAPGDPVAVPANADPDAYGSGNLFSE